MPDTPPPRPTKTFDPVSEYLKDRGCPSHVVRAGLKGLVLNWEKVVSELAFDGYRYGLRDYVKDLDGRELLGGAVGFVAGRIPEALGARIAAADQRFTGATLGASRCLLDGAAGAEPATPGAASWWFFRLPRRHRSAFTEDLGAAGIQALPDQPAGPPRGE